MYPGSIERTSIVEAEEDKGFMIVELTCEDRVVNAEWRFERLPARPLVRHELALDGLDAAQIESAIRTLVANAPADAVVTIRVSGAMTEAVSRVLSARFLRELTPPTMNLELGVAERAATTTRPRMRRQPDDVLELPF